MRSLPRVVACAVLLGGRAALGQEAGAEQTEGADTPTSTGTETPPPAAAPLPPDVGVPPAARPTALPQIGLTFTAKAGATDEAERHGRGAGGVESAVLLGETLQAGARVSLDGNGEGAMFGAAFTLGASLGLARTTRLDLHGDVGLTRYSRDSDANFIVVSEDTHGSTAVLPALALRAGFTFVRERGRFVTVGGFVRTAAREHVRYTVRTCAVLYCSEEQRAVTYGGTTLGGFLTLGFTAGGGGK